MLWFHKENCFHSYSHPLCNLRFDFCAIVFAKDVKDFQIIFRFCSNFTVTTNIVCSLSRFQIQIQIPSPVAMGIPHWFLFYINIV